MKSQWLIGILGVPLITVIMLFLFGCGEQKKSVDEEYNSYSQLKEWFADPPNEFRSAPLWSWCDIITEEGIDFQLEEFKKAGMGGVFVHPRPALVTEYLSDEWFLLFDHAVRKGKELGLNVWIYDENSYPSGYAGGHVPEQMPDSYKHGTGFNVVEQSVFDINPTDTFEVILKQTANGFEDITSNFKKEIGKKGKYYLFEKTYPFTSHWLAGKSYVDLLYRGVTEKFIELTMNGYEKYSGDEFGKTVPGVFTDEPNLVAAMDRQSVLRWTPSLWADFEERWGYNLKEHLPSLLYEVGDWKKIRHDYHSVILDLFVDRWVKPYSEYCEQNGLMLTGHYWEHGWPEPSHGLDEAAMYIYHQLPAIDMLGRDYGEDGLGIQFGNTRAVRELRSAANQAGRRRTLSETYGGAGYEVDFQTLKRLADWQCVLGVNFVNEHLSYYSMRGVRKIDHPVSFSYQVPWWDNYKTMADYLGRISMATSFGEQVNKILVLQPNTTAWMYFSRKSTNEKIDSIRTGFKNFVYRLERQQVEYDLGSEKVLRTLGNVNNGKLVVGERAYSLVVIPESMENIDKFTFELLSKYLQEGGKILSFNSRISRLNGIESKEVSQLAEKYSSQWINARNLEEPNVRSLLSTKDFSIDETTQGSELYHQRRLLDDGQLLFLVNSNTDNQAKMKISANGKSVVRMNLENGQTNMAPFVTDGENVTFSTVLEPTGSALYFISNQIKDEPEAFVGKKEVLLTPDEGVEVTSESDNVLVIDHLDLKTPKSDIKDTYFMDAMVKLYVENGIEFGNPWAHKIQFKKNFLEMDTFTNATAFKVSYHFHVGEGVDLSELGNVKAVAENPELWELYINGKNVKREAGQYWLDKDFAVYNIGNFIKNGQNTITLKAARMSIFAELMPVYVLGDFVLNSNASGFEIQNGNLKTLGSWKTSGYPFYPAKVNYSQNFTVTNLSNSRFKVRLGKWQGKVAEVWVNSEKAGIIGWPPYEMDVTPFVRDGENEITVKVNGSLKNTFGFFYRPETEWIAGPYDWEDSPEGLPSPEDYYLVDYGLFEPFELIVQEK